MRRITEHPAVRFALMPLMAVLLLLTPIYDQWRPVYKAMHVTSVKWVPGGLELWGVIDKQRSCPIVQRHAVLYFRGDGVRRPAVIQGQNMMTPEGKLLSRFLGKSAFGPWFVPAQSDVIAASIYTTHDCWWFRLTEYEQPVWRRGS